MSHAPDPDELVHYARGRRASPRSPWTPSTTATRCPGELVTELFAGLSRPPGRRRRSVVLAAPGPGLLLGGRPRRGPAGGHGGGRPPIVALQRLPWSTDPKPVVTRLQGPVRAGGIGIVAASDVAVAAEDATFALTEVKLGLAAAVISLTVHHRMTPPGGRADHARRRGVHRRPGRGVRPGHAAVPTRRARRRGGARSAPRWRPARPRACASPSGSSTATCSPASTPRGDEIAALSARLFGSDAARRR